MKPLTLYAMALSKAKRGLPRALMSDNGSAMTSEELPKGYKD